MQPEVKSSWHQEKGGCHAVGERQEGSRAARMLHMVRRAERGLMSYDR